MSQGPDDALSSFPAFGASSSLLAHWIRLEKKVLVRLPGLEPDLATEVRLRFHREKQYQRTKRKLEKPS
jgi:hypothetical protein